MRRLVFLYVARRLGRIAERAAARAQESRIENAGTAASEYVGTGAASSPPPPAWLERVLKARAQMRRHAAPRRAVGESRPIGVGMITPAIRPAAPEAAPGERIHLAAPRRELASDGESLPRPRHAAKRSPAVAGQPDRRHDTGAGTGGDRVRIAAGARPDANARTQARTQAHEPTHNSHALPQSHSQLHPNADQVARHTSPTPPTFTRVDPFERDRPLRLARDSRRRTGETLSQDEPIQAPSGTPVDARAAAAPRSASNALSQRLQQFPGGGVRYISGALPAPEPATSGNAVGESPSTLSGSRARAWSTESHAFRGADQPACAQQHTSPFPETWRTESLPAQRHPVTAELPWPSLPDTTHEPVDAQLRLREWNRLQRVRAEQRGHAWNG